MRKKQNKSPKAVRPDLPCICKGNWRKIIYDTDPLIGKKFKNNTGDIYILVGVMHGDDDYYYCMWRDNDMKLLTCVGSIEQQGYVLEA